MLNLIYQVQGIVVTEPYSSIIYHDNGCWQHNTRIKFAVLGITNLHERGSQNNILNLI
ncbi:MAG TPA: hypothetical protein VFP25_02885 [Nitrososphaeraceae archaeon]|nr:hypothetical protein [Nitrososphaeraceae archaeon]